MLLPSTLLPLLALLTSAHAQEQAQHPLGAWFEKLASYLPAGAISSAGQAAAAARPTSSNVTPLTLENWREVLGPKPSVDGVEPEPWWVYVTGGNKTCYGLCGKTDAAWEVGHESSSSRINGDILSPVARNELI